MFVLVSHGEVVYETTERKDALGEAQSAVCQHLSDFRRHDGPFQVTSDDILAFDIKLFELGAAGQVTLPYQKWADNFYWDLEEGEKEEERREYKRYLELREKYEEEAPPKRVKYLVVGGNPVKALTGTTTYTGLMKLGEFESEKEMQECVDENYDKCSGLIDVYTVEL